MAFLRTWGRRILGLVGVVLFLVLVMDLNSRMVHMHRLKGELDAELARVVEMEAEEASYDDQIAYALSDEFVDAWAREQNWLQIEGDFVIALIPNGDPPPVEFFPEEQETPELSNWDAWKWWLTFQE